MKLTHLDLFAGLGAFSLGFDREGFETLCQVEIDANCRKLLSHRFPNVPKHDDVTTFDPDSIACPSIVTFGSPCQDLSVAGQRAGMAGERSGLFYHATRIIRRLVGRGLEFALWENVEGAFSSNGGRDFAGVLAELADCGALDLGWRILDCQHFGLAQRRRRVFLVADFRGRRAAQILSLAEGLQGHPAPSREAGQSIAQAVAGSLGSRGTRSHTELDGHGAYIPTVMAHGQANAETVRDGEPSLTCNHEAPILITHALGARADSSEARNGHGVPCGGDPALQAEATGDSKPLVAFQSSQSGVRQVDQAPTLDSHNGSRRQNGVVGNFGVRRLTPRECERLMGLPDDWTAGFSDSVRYRMIGNSAAVPVIQWLARAAKAVP